MFLRWKEKRREKKRKPSSHASPSSNINYASSNISSFFVDGRKEGLRSLVKLKLTFRRIRQGRIYYNKKGKQCFSYVYMSFFLLFSHVRGRRFVLTSIKFLFFSLSFFFSYDPIYKTPWRHVVWCTDVHLWIQRCYESVILK